MGKLLCDSSAAAVAVEAPAPPPLQLLTWTAPAPPEQAPAPTPAWTSVWALDDQQRRRLLRIWERGVAWKPPRASCPEEEKDGAADDDKDDDAHTGAVFRLDHAGEVESDGNCLFAAAAKAEPR